MLSKIGDTLQIAIAAAFDVFAVWQWMAPVDEALVSQLVAVIILFIGAIIGGPAFARKMIKLGIFPELDSDGKSEK